VLADLGMAGMVLWLVREELRRWWPSQLKDFKSEVQALKKLLVLGVPVGFQQGLEVWGFSIAGLMMGWLGKEVLAAHSLCLNLSSISFMFPFGIGLAACTQVGQLLGAGRDWGRAAGIALGCGAGSMLCFSALFGLFPELPLGIYRPKPEVLAIALGLLPVASAFQLFDGIQGVAFGILRGVGDVRLPALINVIGYYLVGLPLGYYLTFKTDFGARGIWVGLTMALATVAGLLLLRLYRVYRLGGFRV
jgi:MATE family multidrug resistance protein